MFAVIKTGGKQYRVAAEDTITVMSLPGAPGDAVTFDNVLMVGNGASATVGSPLVAGASVGAEIVEQARGPKVYAFKKRRRKNSKRKRGHRQDLTLVRITGFGVDGAAPVRATKAEPAEAMAAEAPAHEASVHEAPPAAAPHAQPPHEAAPHAEAPKPE